MMSDVSLPGSIEPALRRDPQLDHKAHPFTGIGFLGIIAGALLFVAYISRGQISDRVT